MVCISVFKKISICSKDCDICSNGFCFRPEAKNACLKNCDISGQTITLNWRCSCLTLSYPFDVSSKGAINLTINFSHQILITYFQFGPVIFVTKFVVKLILLTLISPWIIAEQFSLRWTPCNIKVAVRKHIFSIMVSSGPRQKHLSSRTVEKELEIYHALDEKCSSQTVFH